MQKRIQKWKRFLAIFLMGAMLLTNDYGLTSVFAEETGSNTGNTRAGEEEVKTNIDLNAKLVINENASTILTGQEFQYEFTYTIPDLGANGGEYSGAKLIFTLPEYVYVPKDAKGNY
ncbi:MAG: hypothetical protein IKL38_00130, partial [Firmicutes bacterium]|nr:hypothetical protein [Bacillota bacterium]